MPVWTVSMAAIVLNMILTLWINFKLLDVNVKELLNDTEKI